MDDKSEAVRVAAWISGILGLLGIIITVLGNLALPFVENYADKIQNTPTLSSTTELIQQELRVTSTTQPTSIVSPTSTRELGPTTTSTMEVMDEATFKPSSNIRISRPDEQEYTNLPNIWDLVSGNKGPANPTTNSFYVTVDSDSTYGWGAIWCGENYEILQKILKPLTMNLVVDGRILTRNEVIEFYTTKNGWNCYRWGTKLSDWKPGETVRLELRYSLSETIYDGNSFTYEGNYSLIIDVQVR